jgi:hypothetical protein
MSRLEPRFGSLVIATEVGKGFQAVIHANLDFVICLAQHLFARAGVKT